jgi:hypothetical protein
MAGFRGSRMEQARMHGTIFAMVRLLSQRDVNRLAFQRFGAHLGLYNQQQNACAQRAHLERSV